MKLIHKARAMAERLLNNRYRFREEVSEGIRQLLHDEKHSQGWLARRLKVSPSRVSQMLDGQNLQLDTLADVAFALNRGVHIVFGVNIDEMRLVEDEAKRAGTTVTVAETRWEPPPSFPIEAYRTAPDPRSTETRVDPTGSGTAKGSVAA